MSKTTRRGFLLAGAGAAVVAGGWAVWSRGQGGEGSPGDLGGGQKCRTPESLTSFDQVGGGRLGYEVSGNTTTMQSDPRFLELLQAWATDWAALSGLGAIREVWSYGAYTDKCNSFHQSGRAFDIARIVHADGKVSCRFDDWGPGSAAQLRAYWRLAASLQMHFSYTLTHLYNGQHDNHIHVDNAVNGYERPAFKTRSRVQAQLIQATLRHVHGQAVEVTGVWDDQTKAALKQVQQRLGITRPLADVDGFHAYLRATAAG